MASEAVDSPIAGDRDRSDRDSFDLDPSEPSLRPQLPGDRLPGEPFPLDESWEPWDLHDEPDRPLDPRAMLCSCVTCEAAVYAQARLRPRLPMLLVTRCDRIVVTLDYLAEVMATDRTLQPLMYVGEDYLRRIEVANGGWMLPPRRWFSEQCRTDDEAAGRRNVLRRVAKRQSRLDRQRMIDAAEDISVMPDGSPRPIVELVPLASAVAPFRQEHRGLVSQVREHAIAHGVSVDPDVVTMILAAYEVPVARRPDRWTTRWTKADVIEFLSADVRNWCSFQRVSMPDGVAEAVWHLFGMLAETGALHADSDPLDELRKPLRCYGGLDATGHPLPDTDEAPEFRCECYVRYRGPSHGELTGRQTGTP